MTSPDTRELDPDREMAVRAVPNRVADAIDPEVLGSEIGDVILEHIAEFPNLVEEPRQLLAEELLATGALTIDQVAERVRYSEASSFIHAFTRWTGGRPRRWTRKQALLAGRH